MLGWFGHLIGFCYSGLEICLCLEIWLHWTRMEIWLVWSFGWTGLDWAGLGCRLVWVCKFGWVGGLVRLEVWLG